jgi:putative ABC transport system permease protein
MSSLVQDLKFALRFFARSRGFTLVALTTLVLGIGGNALIFSVVHAVLLRPVPYPDPDEIVVLGERQAESGELRFVHAAPNFADIRDSAESFEALAAYGFATFDLTEALQPEQLRAARVSEDFFEVLRPRILLGRSFAPADFEAAGAEPVVLEHGLWVRQFGSDPSIVGRTVRLDGVDHPVVGVGGTGFNWPSYADLWVPTDFSGDSDRASPSLTVIGRLNDGIGRGRAQGEVGTIVRNLAAAFPNVNHGTAARLVTLKSYSVGDSRTPMLLLMAAVGFVLLIACTNISHMFLSRAARREGELAVRAALGAGRSRIARQVITECLALSLTGGVLAVLAAAWALPILTRWLPRALPSRDVVTLNGAVLGFALLTSIVAGLLFGLAPALRAAGPKLIESIKSGSGTTGMRASSGALRHGLIISQIALAAVLLIGGGLLIRSFVRLIDVDPGFDADRALALGMVLPSNVYPTSEARRQFMQEAVARLEALPDVERVGGANFLPMSGQDIITEIYLEGADPANPNDARRIAPRVVLPGYFEAMGIPLRSGRRLRDADGPSAPGVAVVNETAARRLWAGNDPVGRKVVLGSSEGAREKTIVGVVADARYGGLAEDTRAEIFIPYAQESWGYFNLVVRSRGDQPPSRVSGRAAGPMGLARQVQSALWEIDPVRPFFGVMPLTALVEYDVAERRFTALVMGAFAAMALLLAAVGTYGVMAYAVGRRRREIGIRMALGAGSGHIARNILGYGLRDVAAGIALGLAGGLLVGRAVDRLLFQVAPTDVFTFILSPLLLLALALAACYVPMRRALQVQPVETLRDV